MTWQMIGLVPPYSWEYLKQMLEDLNAPPTAEISICDEHENEILITWEVPDAIVRSD